MPVGLDISTADPRDPEVSDLLAAHLRFARGTTPAEYSFALDVEGLVGPNVTFVAARRDGTVVGTGALKHLDELHAEIKSMHTRLECRGEGVGRAVLGRLLSLAAARGYARVSLETGTSDDFAPARALYASCGFQPCPAFGIYTDSPHNTFMTIGIDRLPAP